MGSDWAKRSGSLMVMRLDLHLGFYSDWPKAMNLAKPRLMGWLKVMHLAKKKGMHSRPPVSGRSGCRTNNN